MGGCEIRVQVIESSSESSRSVHREREDHTDNLLHSGNTGDNVKSIILERIDQTVFAVSVSLAVWDSLVMSGRFHRQGPGSTHPGKSNT
mmetsp:Transcript_16918/g.36787  ORF Transcript_16918/g.36787 Transcript_16918/m.36787 type:complete len:89 (-) Transcript_16918:4067-4333(-)